MFGLGEIQRFLPGDIDLTDDEVFRDTRRFVHDRGKELKNNPPWDSGNSSGIYLSSSSSRISTWISNIAFNDADILIDDSLFDELIEVHSDEELASTTSSFSTVNTWIDTTSTSLTTGTISFSGNTGITYRINGSTASIHRIKYSNYDVDDECVVQESDEYKNFVEFYKEIPFSPIFKGEKFSVSVNRSYRKLMNLKGSLFGDCKIESVNISDLKFEYGDIYEVTIYHASISSDGWLTENRKRKRDVIIPFGKYDWGDDQEYYDDLKEALPWLDRRANFVITRAFEFA